MTSGEAAFTRSNSNGDGAAGRLSGWWRWLERYGWMLRYVPPRQVMRRIELQLRRRWPGLWPGNLDRPPPPLATDLPPPIFSPRPLLTPEGTGWRFHQPWGSLMLPRRIDWSLPGEDGPTRSWRANLHFMELLEGVDDSAFMELVDDWIVANPQTARGAWRDAWWSYNLSIRTVVWMQQICRRRDRLTSAFIDRAATSLGQQLRFLERHLETDIRGNHLMRNIKTLLWAGACFTGPAAERWRRTGEALLRRELDWQILADSCHYELSPSYHCQVTGDLLEVASVLAPSALRNELLELLDRMVHVAVLLTHPDGRVALFNDGGLDMAYPASALCTAHASFGRPPVVVGNGPFALPAAGFFGLRRDQDYLVVDCGPVGPDDLIGHGHGDILTFEWSISGRRIVVDQGTYQYAAGEDRRRSRSTASHNTITLDGMEQCDFFGAHRCGRRARATVLAHQRRADGFTLTGAHDGFRSLRGQPRHIRRFTAAPRQVTISDQIESGSEHRAAAGLLLHPDCRVVVEGGRATITSGQVTVRVESTVPLVVEPAEWFPNLFTRRTTTRLRQIWSTSTTPLKTTLEADSTI